MTGRAPPPHPDPALAAATTALGRRALAWLDGLDAGQKRVAAYSFDDPARLDWHYAARSRRPGLPLGRMTEAQRAGAWAVAEALLSADGLIRARDVPEVEAVLGAITGRPDVRDPLNYALAVFGDPSGRAPWAFRFEGHHLSLNATLVPGRGVAVTPTFFGANPGRVPDDHPHRPGFRLLGAEEDAAFGLVTSFDDAGRAAVLIGDRSLGDVVAGPGREESLSRFEGLEVARMTGAQADAVLRLVTGYVGCLGDAFAEGALRRLREAGAGRLHFAWAGSLRPGRPHYFRVHGPTLLLEYDNTQNGANHVHTVWHDPRDGFGRDLLRAHHAAAHP